LKKNKLGKGKKKWFLVEVTKVDHGPLGHNVFCKPYGDGSKKLKNLIGDSLIFFCVQRADGVWRERDENQNLIVPMKGDIIEVRGVRLIKKSNYTPEQARIYNGPAFKDKSINQTTENIKKEELKVLNQGEKLEIEEPKSTKPLNSKILLVLAHSVLQKEYQNQMVDVQSLHKKLFELWEDLELNELISVIKDGATNTLNSDIAIITYKTKILVFIPGEGIKVSELLSSSKNIKSKGGNGVDREDQMPPEIDESLKFEELSPSEQFVLKFIHQNREPGNKGVHNSLSGFYREFMKLYNNKELLKKTQQELEKKGLIRAVFIGKNSSFLNLLKKGESLFQ